MEELLTLMSQVTNECRRVLVGIETSTIVVLLTTGSIHPTAELLHVSTRPGCSPYRKKGPAVTKHCIFPDHILEVRSWYKDGKRTHYSKYRFVYCVSGEFKEWLEKNDYVWGCQWVQLQ